MKRRNGNEDQSESSSLSSKKGMQESRETCEICGSIGIADLIMICSKCGDTREHNYCARVFLPSVPPIWLCEVCRLSSRILLIPDVPEGLMDSETTVTDRSSDPKNTNNSRVDDHETAKLRTNDMEEVEDVRTSLPVILQASTSKSTCEISANVIHPPLQPHTSAPAKETSSGFNDSSHNKEQYQPSQAFPKKRRTIRVMGKHLSNSHRGL